MTPDERALVAAVVRLIVGRLHTQAGLLEFVLDSLKQPAEGEGFAAAEHRARTEGRLVVAATRVQ